ncbi:MAG: hypothetical protein ACK45B_12475 [Limisphaerales bacterium]
MNAKTAFIRSIKPHSVIKLFSILTAFGLWSAVAQTFPVATNPPLLEIGGGAFFGSSNYWVGFVSGTNLLGQRVSPGGQLLGAPIPVGSNPGFPPAAATAGARTNALVVWSDYTMMSGVTMFGRICSADNGTVGTAFPLLASAGSHGFQRVRDAASDGTNFLALWVDAADEVDDGLFAKVYGQFISGAGTLVGSEFVVASGSAVHEDVTVAAGRTNYLVAWQQQDGGHYETYCRTVTPSGALGAVTKLSVTPSWDRNPLAAGFDGTNYVVAWNCTTNYGGPGELMLAGRLVSPSGAPLGPEGFLETDGPATFPALAFDGTHHLILWAANAASTNHTIRARFLDRLGNAIGPAFTPFTAQGTNPPLLPLKGALFDGNRFLLTATFGSFVTDTNGDIIGFSGGDVQGRFLQRSTTPPVFTNASLVNGHFQGGLLVVPGVTYTLEISTNLTAWQAAGAVSSDGTNVLHLEDEEPATANPRLFVRAAVGWTGAPTLGLFFFEFANGGGFGGGFTPSPAYPVTLQNYSAVLSVANDLNFPPAASVYFTGPAGSGLTNTPGWLAMGGNNWRMYQAPPVFSPAAAPGGNWVVHYKGSNVTFTVPDPQAASRLLVPLPTVSVSGDVLQNVSWVYKDAATGAPLGGAPAYVTNIQVQIDSIVGGRIYHSPELPPGTTSHTLTTTVNWSNVSTLHMACADTLGNRYIVSFSKP